MQHNLLKRMIL